MPNQMRRALIVRAVGDHEKNEADKDGQGANGAILKQGARYLWKSVMCGAVKVSRLRVRPVQDGVSASGCQEGGNTHTQVSQQPPYDCEKSFGAVETMPAFV